MKNLPPRIVKKFGGTSLQDAASIETVCTLIEQRLSDRPCLVVSAHAGVTDTLIHLAQKAIHETVDLAPLIQRHQDILRELGLPTDLQTSLFQELQDLFRGIQLVGELSPRSRDYVLSFGERASSLCLAAALSHRGHLATAIDAADLGFRSDSNFGQAGLLPDDGRIAKNLRKISEIPVITGFLARDPQGNRTTLGRNGSDLSAAFLGNAIDAKEIQIWTDVDGVLTADPRVVPDAHLIQALSYDEASELAFYGAKVLHPSSLIPAVEKNIPVRVLNTHRPESPGTLILGDLAKEDLAVRCIAHKTNLTMVSILSSRMLAQPGFLARIFRAFEAQEISVDVVATSEVSVSVTLDAGISDSRLTKVQKELGKIGSVQIEKDLALLCIIGHGIRHRTGVPARVFAPLQKEEITIRMISMGALKVNLSLVIQDKDCERALRALHREFFQGSGKGHHG
jgi:aspartate kinase